MRRASGWIAALATAVRRRIGLALWSYQPHTTYGRWMFDAVEPGRRGVETTLPGVRELQRKLRVSAYRRSAVFTGRLLSRKALWRGISLPAQQRYFQAHDDASADQLRSRTEAELTEAGFRSDDYVGRVVLDLGSGPHLRSRFFDGAELLALDPLATWITERLRGSDLGSAAEVHPVALEHRVESLVGRCDLVLSLDALDRGYDADATFANARAYLRSGGTFYLSFESRRTSTRRHPLIVSNAECRALAARHGFEIQSFEVTPDGRRHRNPGRTVRLRYRLAAGPLVTDPRLRHRPAQCSNVVRQSVFPFFVGCPRSGTTLTRALFDAHPQLAIPGESNFIVDLDQHGDEYATDDGFDVEWFVADLFGHPRMRHWQFGELDVHERLVEAAPENLADAMRVVFQTYAAARGKLLCGDKTPRYVHHMDRLAELFPEAKFVHVIRDGRDVGLSMQQVHPERDIDGAAWFWQENVRHGQRSGRKLGPGRYTELRYEALVDDPEACLRPVCTFLGLEYDELMLGYVDRVDELAPSIKSLEHHQNLAQLPTRTRDWRDEMSAADQARFAKVAGTTLAELGYPPSPADTTIR